MQERAHVTTRVHTSTHVSTPTNSHSYLAVNFSFRVEETAARCTQKNGMKQVGGGEKEQLKVEKEGDGGRGRRQTE